MKKRVLAIMLACLMMVSLLPMGALADGVQIKCPGKGANHNLENCSATHVDKVVPTCGTENYGYDIYSCNVCGDLFAAGFYKGDKNEKHTYETVTDKDGYCDKDVCTKCGHTVESHKWTKEPTCTEPVTCTVCGKTSGEAAGHKWGTVPSAILVEPNEQTYESGWAEYTCSVCGETKTVEILAHDCFDTDEAGNFINLVWVDAVDATCTKNGNIGHYDCDKCDRLYVYNKDGKLVEATKEDVTLPLAGHTVPMVDKWGWGEEWLQPDYKNYVAPTCTTTGLAEYTCAVCKEEVKEVLAVEHEWVTDYKVDASCTSYGYVIYVCHLCGENKFEVLKPTGHSERPEDAYYMAPTCTSNALYMWQCTKCGWAEEEVPGTALGHDRKTETVAATCSTVGYTYTYCCRVLKDYYGEGYDAGCDGYTGVFTISGKLPGDANGDGKIEKDETVEHFVYFNEPMYIVSYKFFPGYSTTNHAEPVDAIAVEPTCTTSGLKAFWCAACEKDVVQVLPALGHTKAEKTTTVPATCQADGYVAYCCTVCQKPIEIVEVLKHEAKTIYDSVDEVNAIHVDKNGNPSAIKTGDWTASENFDPCKDTGLYRYECQTCKEVMLVKDSATGHHTAPANLPERVVTMTFSSKDNWGYHQIENPFYGYDAYVTYTVIAAEGMIENEHYQVMYGSNEVVPADLDSIIVYISSWTGDEVIVVATFTFDYFKAAAPTCDTNGHTAQYVCTVCGEFVESETYIPAVKDEEGNVTTAAVHPELAALGHNKLNHVKPVAPTCTTTGVSEGFNCDRCGIVVKSETIPALGHDLESTGTFVKVGEFSGELFHCTRKDCGYEVIKYFVSICDHEWVLDRKLSSASTCTKNGYEAYVCALCGTIEMIELPLAPHVNKAGEVLCQCEEKLPEDNTCVNCKEKIEAKGEHTFGDWTVYPRTCLTEAYMIHYCLFCDEYEVKKIADPAGHSWKWEAWVTDKETGVIVGGAYRCEVCELAEVRNVENIAFSFTIENADNAKGEITDGSLVKVTISVTGKNDGVWGFKFDVPYTSNMTLVKTNYCVDVNDDFVIYGNANKEKTDDVTTQWVTIAGNANGSADVAINETVALVELYFVVDQDVPGVISVDIENVEVLNYKSEKLGFVAYGSEAKTVALMDVNVDGMLDMADILATYKLIVDGKYAAAADIDKNGVVEAADLQAMYKYLIGAKTYAATRKIGMAEVQK